MQIVKNTTENKLRCIGSYFNSPKSRTSVRKFTALHCHQLWHYSRKGGIEQAVRDVNQRKRYTCINSLEQSLREGRRCLSITSQEKSSFTLHKITPPLPTCRSWRKTSQRGRAIEELDGDVIVKPRLGKNSDVWLMPVHRQGYFVKLVADGSEIGQQKGGNLVSLGSPSSL